MNKVPVIFGPTASGKTRLSIELAKVLDGEIISADSMQVYKYMDIGTAKPTKEEMCGIKHYLMDEINPDEEFSVASYQQRALQYIKQIISKGKMPIVVGGTGLYINSLIYNINFSESISDWGYREELKQEALQKGNKYLHDKLREVDPEAAQRLHVNDLKRIIRALEVFKYTRKPISYHQKVSRDNPPIYDFVLAGLTMDRQKLYDRINRRVDSMLESGLVEEVKRLVDMGYDQNSVAMQGLGYKEILAWMKGEISLEEAVYIIKRDTRHYAKRQITWFKRLQNVLWLDMDNFSDICEPVKIIENHIARSGIIL
ncbi:MAG: tRNA (adenosine(37)-N6)-dimethylallyltransferase MiaA [Clostridia bacterium]|nr:tRNA (adenosine(37)-N6)-dimethylallyltransferase MiaA [Clostridia bacterium]